MNTHKPKSSGLKLWLSAAVAMLLAGCGGSHLQAVSHRQLTRPRGSGIVGVNLNSPSSTGPFDTPNRVELRPPDRLMAAARAEFRQGEVVVAESGCLACHLIGGAGNNGPGPALTRVGAHLTQIEIRRTLVNPSAPMPSFSGLPRAKLRALTDFLADLR